MGWAITHLESHNLLGAPVGEGEGGAVGPGELPHDDSIATHKVAFEVKDMHGPSRPMRAACFLHKELGHDRLRRNTTADRIPMLAVVGIHVVCRFEANRKADHRGLLAEIEMAIAAYAGFVVHFLGFFFKVADK